MVKYVIGFFFLPTRKDYVSACIDYIFNISVKAVYEEFQRGFYKVCDKEILVKLFQPEELMAAVVGNTDYDWKQFEEVGDNQSPPTSSKQLLYIPPKIHFSSSISQEFTI